MSFVRFQLGLIDVCISCMCAVCTRYPSISMLIPYNSLPAQTCHTVRIHAHIKSACFFRASNRLKSFSFSAFRYFLSILHANILLSSDLNATSHRNTYICSERKPNITQSVSRFSSLYHHFARIRSYFLIPTYVYGTLQIRV